MIRHDIGRVALPGSVEVPELFSVEQYSTVWQMTSTVRARVEVSNTELLKAVFPCASITGAPKCRAMQIIAELEKSSRGVYTGAIGWMGPGGRAEFGVAIRTLCRFKQSGQAVYGVGGGIVWDSDVREEYEECRTKSLVLDQVWPAFSLLESMLWTPDDGYFLLAYHLERLQATAQYFGFRLDCAAVASKLKAFAYGLKERCKVRLVLDDGGQVHLEASALPDPEPGEVLRVCLADRPINTQTPFVYHKTTRRDMYDAFRQEYPQADEVMLFNALGELTEACASNVAVECEGQLVTPPISSGLLGGTYRRHLLEKGALHERVIHRNELNADSRIFLLNSVRGSRKGRIV
jgi:para-aminobenzoate synthetase/4-amino-4-deoxychorismate lyase